MKQRLYKLMCLICVFTAALSCITLPARADGIVGKAGSVFAYALNDRMYENGIIQTGEPGGDVKTDDGSYPSGVIYSDIIYFDNNDSPYLVIFRADGSAGTVCTDIYRYDEKLQRAELIALISKGYNTDRGVEGQFAVGEDGDTKYIIYREYTDRVETNAEYYTVIEGTAYKYVQTPPCGVSSGIVSWNSEFFRPYVDVSSGNAPLELFFARLKDASADSVSYEDISEKITLAEVDRIETALTRAAGFTSFDIGSFATQNEYNLALTRSNSDDKFYLITNLYDMGDEIYYVRFSTDRSFYNYALLRRTDNTGMPYQILIVRTDSIPLSDIELTRVKEMLSRNNLVAQAARGAIDMEEEPIIQIGGGSTPKTKVFDMPKVFSRSLRRPVALVGGGMCMTALILLWIYLGRDEDECSR